MVFGCLNSGHIKSSRSLDLGMESRIAIRRMLEMAVIVADESAWYRFIGITSSSVRLVMATIKSCVSKINDGAFDRAILMTPLRSWFWRGKKPFFSAASNSAALILHTGTWSGSITKKFAKRSMMVWEVGESLNMI